MLPTQLFDNQVPTQLVETCLNAVNFGVLLVESTGDIIFINGAATDIIRRCSGTNATLHISCIESIKVPILKQRLKELIAKSRKCPVSSQYSHSYQEIDIVACSAQNAGVVIFLRDSKFESSDKFLRRTQKRYELTLREAQIAYELAMGHAVYTIAERLGVQKNTVRMHLKRIYEKTGTCCQSQLVSRLVPNLFLTDVI